jgi:bacterioferritin
MQSVQSTVHGVLLRRHVRQAEADTITRYVERMKQAEEVGDYGLANDLHEIISDETRHKEEAEMLLRGDWTE